MKIPSHWGTYVIDDSAVNVWRYPSGSATTMRFPTTWSSISTQSTTNTHLISRVVPTTTGAVYAPHRPDTGLSGIHKIRQGQPAEITLPDGAVLQVGSDGNYELNDKDAKVIYRGNRIRAFNKYLNASDLLEQFIDFLGNLGVRQSEVLDVPIEVFINWLILSAAEADKIAPPEDVRVAGHPKLLTDRRHKDRCLVCRRFIPKAHVAQQLPFCGEAHMIKRAAALRKVA